MTDTTPEKTNAQTQWQQLTVDYAKAINAFVYKGMTDGWEHAGEEPEDNDREPLVPKLLDAIRIANIEPTSKKLQNLRQQWPLTHSPLINHFEDNSQSIAKVAILDDGRIIARIGAEYEPGYVVEIDDLTVTTLSGFEFFGVCPNNQYFAYAKASGISVTHGWLGDEVAFFTYPDGTEGVNPEYDISPLETPPAPIQMIPFPDGQRVLFVCTGGVFVLSNTHIRLLPTPEDIDMHYQWYAEDDNPEDNFELYIDMAHGAVSSNGKYIAVGSQDSSHLVFNENYQLIGDICNMSEYPHYAFFSKHSDMVLFNSCHFYNGITIGVPTKLLKNKPVFETLSDEDNSQTPVLQDGARVYAASCRYQQNDEFIIGDAGGYIRAFGSDGKSHWHHFIGSSIGDIAVSKDEKTLVCTSYAGFLSIIKLDNQKRQNYEIGTGSHTEYRRWIFWKKEDKPLAW